VAETPPHHRHRGGGAHRHHPLDLLRGLAALGIAAYHYLASIGIVVESLGTFGVYLFFILSALTMTMVYGENFSTYIAVRDVRTFYWNRLTRILPLLAAVSLAWFLLGIC
jgi:peptidoglycan/LPS O-acetylase OafA/YrhL